MFRKHIWRMC